MRTTRVSNLLRNTKARRPRRARTSERSKRGGTLIVGDGDIHAGSSIAICPPEGMVHDDGGQYLPSAQQIWLYEVREHCLRTVQKLIRDIKPAQVVYALNGDLTDGNHHYTHQLITPLESFHVRVAYALLEHSFDLIRPDVIHATRGTPAHVGKGGSLEEGLMRVLREEALWPVAQDPDTKQATSYYRRYRVEGKVVDQKHHGRQGQRAHTRSAYARWYAQDIELEHKRSGDIPPFLALRAHNHLLGDSGRDIDSLVRVITGGCWQLATEWSYRSSFESLPSIGMYAVHVAPDGFDRLYPLAITPERPTLVEHS